ncbi:hypothetical protein H6G65_07900 [Microcystis elabens FACHB-917]|nr:hypothetical protein [Microcystis elabens FACHB-917]
MKLSLPPWRHLRLPLLAALAMNGLLVAVVMRPPTRSGPAAAAPPPDDTPELLRFSRQQAREPALAALPLPPLSSLPPPPPTDLPAQPRRGDGGPRGTEAGSARDRGRTTAATPAPPSAGQESTSTVKGTGAELAATSRMLALALQARPLDAAEATAVAALWEQALPSKEVPAGMVATPEGMELRRLPLARARGSGLAFSDPLAVLAGGRVLLLWPDGTMVWLLAAAGESRAASAGP